MFGLEEFGLFGSLIFIVALVLVAAIAMALKMNKDEVRESENNHAKVRELIKSNQFKTSEHAGFTRRNPKKTSSLSNASSPRKIYSTGKRESVIGFDEDEYFGDQRRSSYDNSSSLNSVGSFSSNNSVSNDSGSSSGSDSGSSSCGGGGGGGCD